MQTRRLRRLSAIGLIGLLMSAAGVFYSSPARADQLPALSRPGYSPDDSNNPLALTDAQQKQIAAIKQKFLDQSKIVVRDPSLTTSQKKAKVLDLETKAIGEIQGCLTPGQRAKMSARANELTKEAASNNAEIARLQARVKKGAEDYIAKRRQLIESISLDQKQQILGLENDITGKLKAIDSDTSLSQHQKDKKLLELKSQYDAKRQALYTRDQRAMFVQLDSIAGETQDAQAKINRLNPILMISPKP